MLNHLPKFAIIILLAFTLLLTGCATPGLTYTNFAKVQQGMTEQEVISILGEPTKVSSMNVDAGLSILGLDSLSGTSMIWADGSAKANVIFFKGKVKSANFTNQF
jgi:hypothetical protein